MVTRDVLKVLNLHSPTARAILRTFKTSLVLINPEMHSRSYDFLYLFHFCYLVIISTRSISTPGELPRNQRVACKLSKIMKNSYACCHVLQKALNLVISRSRCCFAEDGKEMYQNIKRTSRTIVFAH